MSLAAVAAAAAEPLGMTVIINTLVQTLIKTATNCRGSGPVGGGGCQQCDRTAFLVNDITCLRGGRRGVVWRGLLSAGGSSTAAY